jgi:hypothetical protein
VGEEGVTRRRFNNVKRQNIFWDCLFPFRNK